MSEKRFHQFGLWVIDNLNFNGISIADLVDTELMSITEVVDLLNEQQATISALKEENEQLRQTVHNLKQEPTNKDWDLLVQKCAELSKRNVELIEENEQLRQELKEKEEDERLYANEIVELRKINEEWLQFKDLGGDY